MNQSKDYKRVLEVTAERARQAAYLTREEQSAIDDAARSVIRQNAKVAIDDAITKNAAARLGYQKTIKEAMANNRTDVIRAAREKLAHEMRNIRAESLRFIPPGNLSIHPLYPHWVCPFQWFDPPYSLSWGSDPNIGYSDSPNDPVLENNPQRTSGQVVDFSFGDSSQGELSMYAGVSSDAYSSQSNVFPPGQGVEALAGFSCYVNLRPLTTLGIVRVWVDLQIGNQNPLREPSYLGTGFPGEEQVNGAAVEGDVGLWLGTYGAETKSLNANSPQMFLWREKGVIQQRSDFFSRQVSLYQHLVVPAGCSFVIISVSARLKAMIIMGVPAPAYHSPEAEVGFYDPQSLPASVPSTFKDATNAGPIKVTEIAVRSCPVETIQLPKF